MKSSFDKSTAASTQSLSFSALCLLEAGILARFLNQMDREVESSYSICSKVGKPMGLKLWTFEFSVKSYFGSIDGANVLSVAIRSDQSF